MVCLVLQYLIVKNSSLIVTLASGLGISLYSVVLHHDTGLPRTLSCRNVIQN